jgi:hypothetical protein
VVEGAGTLDRAGVRGDGQVQVSLANFSAPFRPWLREMSGILAIGVHADGPVMTGSARVLEPLRLWPRRALTPVEVKSGEVAYGGDHLDARHLSVSVAGASLTVDGGATVDRRALLGSRIDAQVAGTIEGAAVARRLPMLVSQGHGRAVVAGRVGGTASAPTFDGTVDLQGLGGEVPGLPMQVRSMVGRVEGHGRRFTTTGVTVELSPKGHLEIGSPQIPSYIEIAELDPLTPGAFAGRARGKGLASLAPVAGLRLDDLDLDLSVAYQPGGPLRVSGDVWIDAAAFSPVKRRPPSPAVRKTERVVKELFPRVDLDLGLHLRNDGLRVVLPGLPRLGVTADCRVRGPLGAPRVSGRAEGKGLFSRMALGLYDIFSGAHLRDCGDKR